MRDFKKNHDRDYNGGNDGRYDDDNKEDEELITVRKLI